MSTGRNLTAAERRAAGRVPVSIWMSGEAFLALTAIQTRDNLSKTGAIEAALAAFAKAPPAPRKRHPARTPA